MASEATKMVVIGNMHMGVRVIEVTELNSEVRSDLQGHYHCHPLVFRAIALLFVSKVLQIFINGVFMFKKDHNVRTCIE